MEAAKVNLFICSHRELIGVDRIYIGDYFWGIVKTITCGGLIIWSVIDNFLIMGATKRNNYDTLFTILNS